jgi:preprotein translocase subunit YajC
MQPLILLAFMGAIGYFMLIRPLRMQKRQRSQMMSQLEEGAEVLTVGGLYGRVLDLRDDDMDLEIANGVVVRVNRRAVAAVTQETSTAEDAGAGERTDAEAD